MALSLTAFPDETINLKGVPIDYSIENSYADVVGISILSKSTDTANVSVMGLRYQIGEYTNDDIHVSLNLDSVRAPGRYELPLVVSSVNGDNIEAEIEPKTVTVEFDYMVTRVFSVSDNTLVIDTSNITAADGFVLNRSEASIYPESVELYGPRDYVEQITSCVVTPVSGATVKNSVSTSNTTLVMYSENKVMTSDKITASTTHFDLSIPVYTKKDLKFDVLIQSYSDSIDVSSLNYTVFPETVAVISQDDRLKDTDSIPLYIDLKNIDIGSVFSKPISSNSFYENISGYDNVNITFSLDGYARKSFSLRNSQFYVVNSNPDYTVSIEQDRLTVTIIGPQDVIDQLSSSDIVAQFDMLNTNFTSGTNYYTLDVFMPQYNNCWAVGNYGAYISIKEAVKTAEDE